MMTAKSAYNRSARTLPIYNGKSDGECIDIRAVMKIFPGTRWDLVAIGESGKRPAVAARMRCARVVILANSLEEWLLKYGNITELEIGDVMRRLRVIHQKLSTDMCTRLSNGGITSARARPTKQSPSDATKIKPASSTLWGVWGAAVT